MLSLVNLTWFLTIKQGLVDHNRHFLIFCIKNHANILTGVSKRILPSFLWRSSLWISKTYTAETDDSRKQTCVTLVYIKFGSFYGNFGDFFEVYLWWTYVTQNYIHIKRITCQGWVMKYRPDDAVEDEPYIFMPVPTFIVSEFMDLRLHVILVSKF